MLQRRRCRCCVSCIIILVVSISVFYLSTIKSLAYDAYVDVSKYPHFHKYAKNIGGSFETAFNLSEHEDDVLKEVQLRLLMKDSIDVKKYAPRKDKDFNPDTHEPFNILRKYYAKRKVVEKDKNVERSKKENEKGNNQKNSVHNSQGLDTETAEVKGQKDHDTFPNLDVKPVHIAIATNRRSGSSFLGQIFNQNPNVFFHFEPLKVTEWKKELYPNASNLVRNIMKCKFDDTPYLMDMYNKEVLHRESSKALTIPPLCDLTNLKGRYKNPVRFCPNLNNSLAIDICKRYRHIAVKMIRMYSIESLKDIVNDPELNVKVIHLVRDPRGIYISRTKAENKVLTIGDELDQDLSYTCRRMKRNLDFMKSAPTWLNGRYIRVRYEEVAENPSLWVQKLYNFTGLGKVPKEVLDWIDVNTQSSRPSGNSYSTRRNSAMTAQAWRNDVTIDIVKYMQDIGLCRPVLSELGYVEIRNESELTNLNHSLVIQGN